MLRQWLACILLGAVNIEQSKFLQWSALDYLLGSTIKSPATQRDLLRAQAAPPVLACIFRWNYQHVIDYRDDHDHYRNLTQSGGILRWNGREMEVHLIPRTQYQPKLKKVVEQLLEHYNQRDLKMPDGSGRPLKFYLGNWGDFEIKPVASR